MLIMVVRVQKYRLYCSETEKYFRYGRNRNGLIANLMTMRRERLSDRIMGNMFHSWKSLLQYSDMIFGGQLGYGAVSYESRIELRFGQDG